MQYRTQDKVCVVFGDDLNELASFLQTEPRQWSFNASRGNGANQNWDFGTGYKGAWKLAHTGWTAGALDIADKLTALPPNEAEPEYTLDVAGYMPDVGLYCAGEPMHMMNDGHPQGRRPIVHLVINVVCSAIVSANAFKNYGAAITAMIGQIEASGRQVELDVVAVHKLKGDNDGIFGWKVKRAGDNTDLGAVAFSIGHPAAFRRIGFALCERSPRAWESFGYGQCAGLSKELAKHIGAEEAFLLDGIGTNYLACNTLEGALKLAAQQINKAAGEELVTLNA